MSPSTLHTTMNRLGLSQRALATAVNIPIGALFVTRDLIDGERRITFYHRTDDETRRHILARPDIWCPAMLLGFTQRRADGLVRHRVRVTKPVSWFIGTATPVSRYRTSVEGHHESI